MNSGDEAKKDYTYKKKCIVRIHIRKQIIINCNCRSRKWKIFKKNKKKKTTNLILSNNCAF